MAAKKVLRAVRYMERRLTAGGLNISKVVLFGSHARGRATPDSDVDVAIISEDFRDRGLLERADMTIGAEAEAIKKFLVPFDIVTLTPEEFEHGSSLVAQYARQGVAL